MNNLKLKIVGNRYLTSIYQENDYVIKNPTLKVSEYPIY